jgi:hypothetical protein
VEVHAELNTLAINVLRIVGSVNISGILRAHPLVVVIEDGINDTITNGLGNDLLGLFD